MSRYEGANWGSTIPQTRQSQSSYNNQQSLRDLRSPDDDVRGGSGPESQVMFSVPRQRGGSNTFTQLAESEFPQTDECRMMPGNNFEGCNKNETKNCPQSSSLKGMGNSIDVGKDTEYGEQNPVDKRFRGNTTRVETFGEEKEHFPVFTKTENTGSFSSYHERSIEQKNVPQMQTSYEKIPGARDFSRSFNSMSKEDLVLANETLEKIRGIQKRSFSGSFNLESGLTKSIGFNDSQGFKDNSNTQQPLYRTASDSDINNFPHKGIKPPAAASKKNGRARFTDETVKRLLSYAGKNDVVVRELENDISNTTSYDINKNELSGYGSFNQGSRLQNSFGTEKRVQKRRIEDDLLERHRRKMEEKEMLKNAIISIEKRRREVRPNERSLKIIQNMRRNIKLQQQYLEIQSHREKYSSHQPPHIERDDADQYLYKNITAAPDDISQIGRDSRNSSINSSFNDIDNNLRNAKETGFFSSYKQPIKSSEELSLEQATFKPKTNNCDGILQNRPKPKELTEILYKQGVKKRQKDRESEEILQRKIYKSEQEAFKTKTQPEITEEQEKMINRLIGDWKRHNENMKKRKLESEVKKLEGCTFRPEIIHDSFGSSDNQTKPLQRGQEIELSPNVKYREQKAEELFLSRCESAKRERERAHSALNRRPKWNGGVTVPVEFGLTKSNSSLNRSRSSICNESPTIPSLRPPVQANKNVPNTAVSLAVGKVKIEKPGAFNKSQIDGNRACLVSYFDAGEVCNSPQLTVDEVE